MYAKNEKQPFCFHWASGCQFLPEPFKVQLRSEVCHIYTTYIFVNVWRQKDFHQYLSKEKVLFLIIWWDGLFGQSLLLKGAKNAIENRKDFLEALKSWQDSDRTVLMFHLCKLLKRTNGTQTVTNKPNDTTNE